MLFQRLLFLGAGSVIHGMHEEQDIKKMGSLKKYMPVTHKTFMIATLAIAGVPFFSGFFSKDEIMWNVYNNGGFAAWLVLAVAAFCTAFYMFRLTYLVFYGTERFDSNKIKPHESPKTMTVPLVILAFLSAFGGFVGIPYALGFWASPHPNVLENWLTPVFADANNILRLGVHEIHNIRIFIIIMHCYCTIRIYLAEKYINQRLE